MDYSSQLKKIAKAAGLTQVELAARLGVSFATVNSWLNRRSVPRPSALNRIGLLYVQVVGGSSVGVGDLAEIVRLAESTRFSIHSITNNHELLTDLSVALTYNTNAIEGSTMTIADTEAVLIDGLVITGRSQREQFEAKNHETALLWMLAELRRNQFLIDDDLILTLHSKLMNGLVDDAGEYRRHQVRIARSTVVVANYAKVPQLVDRLCANVLKSTTDVVGLLARQHAEFEKIHPFSDGNGRIGRLLLLALALKHGLVPPIIERVRRSFYYQALESAQTKGNYAALEQIIAESIISADESVFSLHRN